MYSYTNLDGPRMDAEKTQPSSHRDAQSLAHYGCTVTSCMRETEREPTRPPGKDPVRNWCVVLVPWKMPWASGVCM